MVHTKIPDSDMWLSYIKHCRWETMKDVYVASSHTYLLGTTGGPTWQGGLASDFAVTTVEYSHHLSNGRAQLAPFPTSGHSLWLFWSWIPAWGSVRSWSSTWSPVWTESRDQTTWGAQPEALSNQESLRTSAHNRNQLQTLHRGLAQTGNLACDTTQRWLQSPASGPTKM